MALRGGGLAVNKPEDLDCGFDVRCCWHNIAGGSDDLEWAVVLDQPDYTKALRQFGVRQTPSTVLDSSTSHYANSPQPIFKAVLR